MKKVAFSLDNVSLERDGKFILRDLSFTVGEVKGGLSLALMVQGKRPCFGSLVLFTPKQWER